MATHRVDDLTTTQVCINGQWVVARPENYKHEPFLWRLRSAWLVLIGKADAVVFNEGNGSR